MKRLPAAIAAASLLLTSCFTGIESTPKIRELPPDKTSAATTDPCDTLLDDVVGQSVAAWQPGKRFVVTDGRFTMLLGASAPAASLKGATIAYAGRRETPGVTGGRIVSLLFTTPAGDTVSYNTEGEPRLNPPFLVQQSMIDAATAKLVGPTFYLKTDNWRDRDNAIIKGIKFVAVRIERIEAGDDDTPLRLDFVTTGDTSPRRGSLLVAPGPDDGQHSSRRLGSMLTATNPRDLHRDIPAEIWERIVNGDVTAGMTADQVRLSLGRPLSVRRSGGNGVALQREQWIYASGRIVTLEDNLVVTD